VAAPTISGATYKEIRARLPPIAGLGGFADAAAAEPFKSIPMLLLHGEKDSIIPPAVSRRSVLALQAVGAQHVYLEFPGKDHEFFIRRGAEHMEKVFLSFATVSKHTNVGLVTPETAPA
jgi:alpha-beta hydrolase superfamily lysophospholipase